jgi:hypothetical protein
MIHPMIYYLAWQEDDWLDEILDYFPQVNAMVPSAKTLEQIRGQREQGEVDRPLFVVNVAGEEEKSREFLRLLQSEEVFADDPVYLVGMDEGAAATWRNAFPQAKVIVITGHPFEFDYESVFRQMEAELEGAK